MAMSAREAFERGTNAFNAHDMKGFAEVLADDVAFAAPGGIRGQGKTSCTEFFGAWFGAFPDAHVEVQRCYFIDDVAVEEGTFSGTHNGVLHSPIGDFPPTGRSAEVPYVQVLRFRDGMHVSFNLMFDWLTMLEQLGVAPVSARSIAAQ